MAFPHYLEKLALKALPVYCLQFIFRAATIHFLRIPYIYRNKWHDRSDTRYVP